MRRLGIVLAVIAGLLVVLVVVAVAVGVWQVRRGFPAYDGEAALPGLTDEVDVVRNAYGIPTIYADTGEDLFRAQGYVHAQDRFFEMDFRRLLTAGRLTELAGEAAIETDVFIRSLGWRRIAEEEVGLLSPDARRYLQAYADGVNAWLEQTPPGERGIHYTLLGVQGVERDPEPWTIADSLAFARFVAWNLRHNPDEEAQRAVLRSTLPDERVDQLYPPFRFDEMTTILSEEDLEQSGLTGEAVPVGAPETPASAVPALEAASRAIGSVPGVGVGGGVGSNSWVVGAARTSSGGALLANDPHLAPTIPALFTQMGLRCRVVSEVCPFDVRGFSAAAIPGIAIGHNGQIAWGWTTPYVDTSDLVLEKVRGEEYLTEDGYVALETRTETLQVAGGEPVEVTLRSTRNGPIITSADVSSTFALPNLEGVGDEADVPSGSPPRGEGYEVAIRWVASEPGTAIASLLELNAATDWEEFTAALEGIDSLAQNIVYADADGNTGYYIFGDVPIRRGYDGSLPVPGWVEEYEWVGTIPFESKPHVYRPARQFVATANEQTVPESYPFLLTTEGTFAYRGDRLRDYLADDDDVSVEEAVALQMDSWSWMAQAMVPYLLDIDDLEPYYAEGAELLEDWDFGHEPGSAPAAYFNAVYARTLALTFRDELDEEYWPDGRNRWFVVLDDLLAAPEDPYWDDVTTEDVVETRDAILRRAMIEARDELTASQSKDPSSWEWGRMHGLDLVDSVFGESGVAPVEWLFNRGPYPAGGGSNILLANSWDADDEGYTITNAPTFRMVVDFGDLDSSVWVNTTGQSGHPGHPHYDDQVALWQSNEAPAMAWTDEAIEAESEHRLTLVPGRG